MDNFYSNYFSKTIHIVSGLISLPIAISTLCVAIKLSIQHKQLNKSIFAIILMIVYIEGLQIFLFFYSGKIKNVDLEHDLSYTASYITSSATFSLYLSPLNTWIFIWE